MNEPDNTKRDYTRVFREYPSERTFMPDESHPVMLAAALGIGSTVAYLVSPAVPVIPTGLTAALTSPVYTVLAYIMIHMATGRRWVVECDEP